MSRRRFYQRSETDCLLTALECLVQRPREEMGEGDDGTLTFFPGGYLTYASVARVLGRADAPSTYLLRPTDQIQTILKEPVPMILGLRLPTHPVGFAFHSVYWDGTRAWEPWERRYMRESMDDMKVAYAVVAAKESHYTGPRFQIGDMAQWDQTAGDQSAEANQRRAEYEKSGMRFLRVVS